MSGRSLFSFILYVLMLMFQNLVVVCVMHKSSVSFVLFC